MKINFGKIPVKHRLVLLLITFVIAFALIVGTLAEKSIALNPDEGELGEGPVSVNGLVINEIMIDNESAFASPKGGLFDWVELYNGSNHSINLRNFGLSDTLDETKWIFPDVKIESKSYLVVYLTGKNQSGLYANFSLTAEGGETLVLRNPSGNVIESYVLPESMENRSIGRDASNKWVTYRQITPGYENSTSGYQAFLTERIKTESPLRITEFLARNAGNVLLSPQGLSGYIEITNDSNQAIDLKDYALGDTLETPYRWHFPDISLKAGGSIVVYTTGKEEVEGYLATNFRLNEGEGTVLLSDKEGKILSQVDYRNIVNGFAVSMRDGKQMHDPFLSPGYSNDPDGITKYNASLDVPKGLIISEAMNENTKYLAQNGAQHYDWIELQNRSNKPILLSEYSLTTSTNTPDRYVLPNITLQPGDFYVVMASGDVNLSNSSYKHTDFKLSEVESLYLYHQGNLADSVFLAKIPINYSYARNENGGFTYSASPTPRSANVNGLTMVSALPESNVAAGVYNQTETLSVTLTTSGTTYYTLDGSEPNRQSKIYNGPITIQKTSVIRAKTIEDKKIPSRVATFSYIVNENHTLPVVSVAMDQDDFGKLSRNPWQVGLEYPSNVELFEEGKGFSLECGFQLFGGSTRGLDKKSFELNFRSEYGTGLLHYQVFEKRDFSVFNKLVIRSGSQDYNTAYLRDIFASEMMEDSETVEVQAYKSIILYINGKYWGVYDIREKVDEYFVSTHYNVPKETANIVRADSVASAGSGAGISQIIRYANSHDMSLDSNYRYVTDRLNIDSYIDFWVAETYSTNNDIINTRYMNSTVYDDGKWHMIFYDLDYGFYFVNRDYFKFMVNPEGMSDFKVSTVLMRNLMKNADFRDTFLTRLSLGLSGTWKEENVLNKLNAIYETLKPEMERDTRRWGFTMSEWNSEVERLRTFVRNRQDALLRQARSFFALDNETFNAYFGTLT